MPRLPRSTRPEFFRFGWFAVRSAGDTLRSLTPPLIASLICDCEPLDDLSSAADLAVLPLMTRVVDGFLNFGIGGGGGGGPAAAIGALPAGPGGGGGPPVIGASSLLLCYCCF